MPHGSGAFDRQRQDEAAGAVAPVADDDGCPDTKPEKVVVRKRRIEILEKRRVWEPENGIYGLPKTRVAKVMKGGKKKEKKAEGEA